MRLDWSNSRFVNILPQQWTNQSGTSLDEKRLFDSMCCGLTPNRSALSKKR